MKFDVPKQRPGCRIFSGLRLLCYKEQTTRLHTVRVRDLTLFGSLAGSRRASISARQETASKQLIYAAIESPCLTTNLWKARLIRASWWRLGIYPLDPITDFGGNDWRTSPLHPLPPRRFIIGKGTNPFFIPVEASWKWASVDLPRTTQYCAISFSPSGRYGRLRLITLAFRVVDQNFIPIEGHLSQGPSRTRAFGRPTVAGL